MKSKVYFIPANSSENISVFIGKIKKLLDVSKVLDFIQKKNKVAVKAHFGEEGNANYIRPEYFRVVCDRITAQGARPILSDANTLYRGRRKDSKEHLTLAHEHGFTKKTTGADIFIPDDNIKEETCDVAIDRKFIKTAKVDRFFIDADAIVAVSHFKGHILTGFGGAIKNIGMGCATREGKLAQHCDLSPVVHAENCVGCGDCERICPVGAISIENEKSVVNKSLCIGCASCIGVCQTMAMFIDFKAGDAVQMKMAEYSLAVLKGRKKAGFINFAVRISKECDCWSQENPLIASDVGIFASSDPVSIDKAGLDLLNEACGRDVFKEVHPDTNGMVQLRHAQSMGLGNLDYELIKLLPG